MGDLLKYGIAQQIKNLQSGGGDDEWSYIGEMTVGGIPGDHTGWQSLATPTTFGSISPPNPIVPGFSELRTIILEHYQYDLYVYDANSNCCCNVIEIDGIQFEMMGSNKWGPWAPINLIVGQTVVVKLK